MVAATSSIIFLLLAPVVNGDTALADGTACALGSTCNNCEHNATWWSTDVFTACGEQPADADLPTCALNADLTAACKCSTRICGIGHYCYGDAGEENCHHAEQSITCAVDAAGATAVTTACKCGGSFVSSITAGLVDAAPECSVDEFCYDNTCNVAAKVVTPAVPLVPVIGGCAVTAFGCCSSDTVAKIDAAGSNCETKDDSFSMPIWGWIAIVVGICCCGPLLGMLCFGKTFYECCCDDCFGLCPKDDKDTSSGEELLDE